MHIFAVSIIGASYLYAILFNYKLLIIQAVIILLYFIYSLSYFKTSKTTLRKKISISSWGEPNDGKLMGDIPLDCKIIDDFIDSFNEKNLNNKISYTHFFAKVLGITFSEMRETHGKSVFGEFVPIVNVDISFPVDIDGKDLAFKRIENCESLSLLELRKKSNKEFKNIKKGNDREFNHVIETLKKIPSCLITGMFYLSKLLTYNLEFENKKQFMKKNQFGTLVITNVSKMNMPVAYPPLAHLLSYICIFSITEPKFRVVVERNTEIKKKKILNLIFDFDHRFLDWHQLDFMISRISEICQSPEQHLI